MSRSLSFPICNMGVVTPHRVVEIFEGFAHLKKFSYNDYY